MWVPVKIINITSNPSRKEFQHHKKCFVSALERVNKIPMIVIFRKVF